MRKFFIVFSFILLSTITLSVSAQTYELHLDDKDSGRGQTKVSLPITVDTAKWSIVYIHVRKDTFLNQERTDFEMLQVGDTHRWYGGYGDFRLDSIQRVDPDKLTRMNHSECLKFMNEVKTVSEEMLISLQTDSLDFYDRVFLDSYRYAEPVPVFDWKLEDESCKVMGYTCFKATAHWRGRDWTAWYSDIPAPYGPWKFNGLPGLILRLEDSTGSHLFEAIETKNTPAPFGYPKKKYINITRIKFNSALKYYKENAADIIKKSYIIHSISSSSGKNKKKGKRCLFFVPIELE